jgi:prevent-host-death family protein
MSKEPEVITVTELRNMTREIIENAHFRGRQYVVERAGQPMVVILGVQEYMGLLQVAKDMRSEGKIAENQPRP